MNKALLVLISIGLVLSEAISSHATHAEHRSHAQHRSDHHLKHAVRNQHHNRAQIGNRNFEQDLLDFYSNGTSSVIAFCNSTSETAVIFSFKSSYTLVLNGKSGNAILIDGNHHTITLLHHVWVASTQNFEQFFKSLAVLKNIAPSGETNNARALQQLNRLALNLGIDSNALESFLKISKILNEGRALLVAILHKPVHFRTSRGVLGGVLVLKGLIDLFEHNRQDLTKDLDLLSIYEAPNGAEALLRVLRNYHNLDLSTIAGNSLNNLDILLKIMVELGGNNSGNGVNNVIQIVYDILLLIRGQTDRLDDLIRVLLQASQNGGFEISGSDITPMIDELLKLAETQNRFNSTILDVFIKFMRDMNDNNLFLNGTNISELLHVLQKHDYTGWIDRMVRFFVPMNNIVNLTKSIPRFFGYLLSLLNSTRGCALLSNLFPGVSSNELQALRAVNIGQLMQSGQNFSQFPLVEHIFTNISNSLGNATNGSQNFWQILNPNALSAVGNRNNLFSRFTEWFNSNRGGGFSWLSPTQIFPGLSNLNPLNGLFNPLQPPGQINISDDCLNTTTEGTESVTDGAVTSTPDIEDGSGEKRAKVGKRGGHFKDLRKYPNHVKGQARKYNKHEKNHE